MSVLRVPANLQSRAAELIGLPFAAKGRTPAGFDCLGLARWCYAEWCGHPLPTYEDLYEADIVSPGGRRERARRLAGGLAAWRPAEPQAGACALLTFLGVAGHVGFMLTPRLILHADSNVGVSQLDLDDPAARYRLAGAFLPSSISEIVRV